MFTYISPKCLKLVFIFLGLNFLSWVWNSVCPRTLYSAETPKLTNTAQPTETFHTCDVSWLLLEERGTPCWWVYQGFGLLNTGLSFLCVSVCWWAKRSSVHCPPEAINRSDEMKSLCSLPKLLREICMAMFWQPVALNHHFMTARENVSMFPPMIYVHWSLEDMIIWPRQIDWEIPKGFCAKTLSCAVQMESTCWRKILTSLFISSTSHASSPAYEWITLMFNSAGERSSLIIHNESYNHKRAYRVRPTSQTKLDLMPLISGTTVFHAEQSRLSDWKVKSSKFPPWLQMYNEMGLLYHFLHIFLLQSQQCHCLYKAAIIWLLALL